MEYLKTRQAEQVKTREMNSSRAGYHSLPGYDYGEHQKGDVFERNPIVSSSPSGHRRRREKHEVRDRLHSESTIEMMVVDHMTAMEFAGIWARRWSEKFERLFRKIGGILTDV